MLANGARSIMLRIHVVVDFLAQNWWPLMLTWLHVRGVRRLVPDDAVVLRNCHACVALKRHVGAQNGGIHVLLSGVHVRDLILWSYSACGFSSLWL